MVDFYGQKQRIYSEMNRIVDLFKRRDECIDKKAFIDELRITFGVGNRMLEDYLEVLIRKKIIKIIPADLKSGEPELIEPLAETKHLYEYQNENDNENVS